MSNLESRIPDQIANATFLRTKDQLKTLALEMGLSYEAARRAQDLKFYPHAKHYSALSGGP